MWIYTSTFSSYGTEYFTLQPGRFESKTKKLVGCSNTSTLNEKYYTKETHGNPNEQPFLQQMLIQLALLLQV